MRLFHCLRRGDFSLRFEFQSATFFGFALWNCTLKIDVRRDLNNWERDATMYTREGGVIFSLKMLIWAECGYPKSQDGVKILCNI